jgi:muconate cycloisomerase
MLGLMPVEEALEEARAAVDDGVFALQVKGGQDGTRDADLVARLRGELGDDIVIRLDANGGYSGRAATRHQLEALGEAGVDFVEQPVLGVDELAAATRSSPVPIIADESCWTPSDALALACRRAADALSVYVGKPGGLSRAQSVCCIAAAARVPHDVNGALELGIGNAANIHLALASPAELLPSVIPVNAPAGAHTTRTAGRYFEDDVITDPVPYEAGFVAAPAGPGLAVQVDRDKIEHYCVERRSTSGAAYERRRP